MTDGLKRKDEMVHKYITLNGYLLRDVVPSGFGMNPVDQLLHIVHLLEEHEEQEHEVEHTHSYNKRAP